VRRVRRRRWGQKLRADGTTDGEIDGDGEEEGGDANCGVVMIDGCAHGDTIVPDEPVHDGVLPLFGALWEEQVGHHRGNDDGEAECA
jgi:hypothetical protein